VALELAKVGNDGLAELCAKYPEQFVGFVAQAPITAMDAGVGESERAVKQLGALGVQIFTNVAGKPVDRPEFEAFFAGMDKLGAPIWTHPARGANHPDYMDEKKSLYEIWWTFGWSYETAAMMARLVFSKTLDKYPNLKIIVHHFGGIVPMLEGRIGPGWDQLGARTSDEDYEALRKSLKKRPIDYFKQNFIADTATFGGVGATKAGFDFFPMDQVVFASDCPFDPEKGPGYIRSTLKILDEFGLSKEDLDKVYYKNLERITGKKLVK
jgi:aminocarboxymuconate-semialdehyde decarboxylase